jgi:hypothetical protein
VLFLVGDFLVNVVALGRLPFRWQESYFSVPQFLIPMEYLLRAVVALGAAWIISRCAYGAGLLHNLSTCRAQVARRDDV